MSCPEHRTRTFQLDFEVKVFYVAQSPWQFPIQTPNASMQMESRGVDASSVVDMAVPFLSHFRVKLPIDEEDGGAADDAIGAQNFGGLI